MPNFSALEAERALPQGTWRRLTEALARGTLTRLPSETLLRKA